MYSVVEDRNSAYFIVRIGALTLSSSFFLFPLFLSSIHTSIYIYIFKGASEIEATAEDCNVAIMAHEMIQFRYALVVGAPSSLSSSSSSSLYFPLTAHAWVLQHRVGGTGENPFEFSCSTSRPVTPAMRSMSGHRPLAPSVHRSNAVSPSHTVDSAPLFPASPTGSYSPPSFAFFSSSSPSLDKVFNFTAYTAVATALDINVDSRTRQRDMCHLDAFITNQEQYAIFPPGDYTIQQRTALFAFSNDSSPLITWMEFRMYGVLMVELDALETGCLALAEHTWASNDTALVVADNGVLNSISFSAGLLYFNLSGRSLLSFPSDCLGPWDCRVLAD